MALDMTSFAAALKQHYQDLTVRNMVYQVNAFLGLVSKYERFGGLNMPFPIIYGNPQNRSADFATAVAGTSTSLIKAFTLTRNHDYSIANIDNETLLASEGDANAFMRASTTEIDGSIHSCARSLATALARNGTGSIGIIGTVVGTVITLSNPDDVVNFEVGMVLAASATDGAGLQAGTQTISAIDRTAGTLTAAANWSAGIPTIANGQYLLVSGDFNAKIKGLAAWLPFTAPTAGDNFFGVDRSVDVTRFSGLRRDYTGVPIEEALIDLSALIGREGGRPDKLFFSFQNYANLEKALGSKAVYVNVQSEGSYNIGFPGMKVMGARGPIEVVGDQNFPDSYMYMLQMNTWQLASLGMAPRLFNSDGLDWLRNQASDSLQIRVSYYAQLGSFAPGWNGVGKLS